MKIEWKCGYGAIAELAVRRPTATSARRSRSRFTSTQTRDVERSSLPVPRRDPHSRRDRLRTPIVQVPLSASGARVRSSERQSAGRAPELRRPRKARQRPAQPRCPWGDECRSWAQRDVARRGARCQSNRVDDGSGRAVPCTMMPFARACRSQVGLDRPDGGPVGTTAAGQAAPRQGGEVLETRDSPSVRSDIPEAAVGLRETVGFARGDLGVWTRAQSEHHDDRLEGVVFARQPSASACSSSARVHSRSPLAARYTSMPALQAAQSRRRCRSRSHWLAQPGCNGSRSVVSHARRNVDASVSIFGPWMTDSPA